MRKCESLFGIVIAVWLPGGIFVGNMFVYYSFLFPFFWENTVMYSKERRPSSYMAHHILQEQNVELRVRVRLHPITRTDGIPWLGPKVVSSLQAEACIA